jgi:UDP-N-acetylglucosamine acyltransferase
MTQIHPSAVIGERVSIGEDTVIGPFCVIEDDVVIGKGNNLLANLYIGKYTTIGDNNRFFPFSTIGVVPQDLKFGTERTDCIIGNDNTIREHVSIHRGTQHGGGVTRVGDHNLLMVNSHIAHDCAVGNHTILSHGGTLAGHVEVGHHATVGAYSAVHQFCRVADYAFIGGFSVVTQDALPYIKTVGNRANIYGINTIGLKRSGFDKDEVRRLQDAYKILFRQGLRMEEALQQLEEKYPECDKVKYLIDFIRSAKRGVVRSSPKRGSSED